MELKCKSCGGNLNYEQGAQKIVCPFCGTVSFIEKVEINNYYGVSAAKAVKPKTEAVPLVIEKKKAEIPFSNKEEMIKFFSGNGKWTQKDACVVSICEYKGHLYLKNEGTTYEIMDYSDGRLIISLGVCGIYIKDIPEKLSKDQITFWEDGSFTVFDRNFVYKDANAKTHEDVDAFKGMSDDEKTKATIARLETARKLPTSIEDGKREKFDMTYDQLVSFIGDRTFSFTGPKEGVDETYKGKQEMIDRYHIFFDKTRNAICWQHDYTKYYSDIDKNHKEHRTYYVQSDLSIATELNEFNSLIFTDVHDEKIETTPLQISEIILSDPRAIIVSNGDYYIEGTDKKSKEVSVDAQERRVNAIRAGERPPFRPGIFIGGLILLVISYFPIRWGINFQAEHGFNLISLLLWLVASPFAICGLYFALGEMFGSRRADLDESNPKQ